MMCAAEARKEQNGRFVIRRDWYLGIERLLRVEGEFALPSIFDDLFAWSSLL
jgi:hypothetical protein